MLTEEQIKSLIEAAKGDNPAEKLGQLVAPMIQSAADAVVSEEVAGIKANRDEFRRDLDKYKPLGKPEEIQEALTELKTLRAAKGKKPDPEEMKALVDQEVEERVATFRVEQEALRSSIEEERDGATARAQMLHDSLLRQKKQEELLRHAGTGLRELMTPYFVDRLGKMLEPVEENGKAWFEQDVVKWKVVHPETRAPLTGKGGGLTPGELVESGKLGLGDQEWNDKRFSETFYEPKGKGGGYVAPGQVPTSPPGHVDPSASSYDHFGALYGDQ